VTLAEPVRIGAPRTHFLRAVLSTGEGGERVARLTGPQGSGILTSMSRANALLVVPHDRSEVAAGETLNAIPLGEDAELSARFEL
jgi:molybdopterin molybdotransferase